MSPLLIYALPVLTIGLLILIHELGHFLAARALGLPVARFSVGFGPALLSRRMGGVEYRLSLIPLGGYVLADLEDHHDYLDLPWSKKVLFSLGGPLANLITAAFLYALLALFSGQTSPEALFLEPLARTFRACGQTLAGLAALVNAPGSLTGLVGLVVEGGRFAGLDGLRSLRFAAWLSVNLAVFNLLPLPPLDGGKMLLDSLQRFCRPLARIYLPACLAGWLALVGLMVYATAMDAGRYLI